MEYKFSDRVLTLKPSAIREIFKYAADPSYVSLSAGNPAPEAFPSKQLAAISAKLMEEEPILALQYSTTEGYPPLLQHLKEYMKSSRNIGTEDDGVLVTSGAQQIMDLFTKSILNEGETVICEAPSFIGSLNDFRSYKAKLVGIPMDTDGMNMEALEKALETEKNVKFIYTIPNFQNPSGITMSPEKRRAVLALAERYGVVILEDNPYGELRFDGEDVPTIKSLDRGGQVLYCSSFSKILSAGMRVGFLCGNKDLIQKIVVVKQVNDVHTNIFFQMLASRFMEVYGLDEHIASIRALYKRKSALMVDALEEQLGGVLEIVRPQGGLFIWGTLPDKYDSAVFAKKAIGNMVAVVEGKTFAPDQSVVSHSFRMNYSTPTDDQIVEGVRRLRKTLEQYDA